MFRSSILQINCSCHLNWGFPERIPSSGVNYTALSCLHTTEEQWRTAVPYLEIGKTQSLSVSVTYQYHEKGRAWLEVGSCPHSCISVHSKASLELSRLNQTEDHSQTSGWLPIVGQGMSWCHTRRQGLGDPPLCRVGPDPTEDRGWAAAHLIIAQAITQDQRTLYFGCGRKEK